MFSSSFPAGAGRGDVALDVEYLYLVDPRSGVRAILLLGWRDRRRHDTHKGLLNISRFVRDSNCSIVFDVSPRTETNYESCCQKVLTLKMPRWLRIT